LKSCASKYDFNVENLSHLNSYLKAQFIRLEIVLPTIIYSNV